MASNTAVIRFDIDTYKCIHEGVPRLLELADELDIRFTFFINFGRAVSHRARIRSVASRSKSSQQDEGVAAHFSAYRKLGPTAYLETALWNPRINRAQEQILEIVKRGHELGLHGGRNHAAWAAGAQNWSRPKLADEVAWGIEQYRKIIGQMPSGFASPEWVTPPLLPGVLAEQSFRYLADAHGRFGPAAGSDIGEVVTWLTGEPGGVGYFEHLLALGQDARKIASDTTAEFTTSTQSYIAMYDHPYFAGCEAIDVVRNTLLSLKDSGINFSTFDQIVSRWAL